MSGTAKWDHVESLRPGGRLSPYIHWTSAWSHMEPPVNAADLVRTGFGWLDRAVAAALGDAPQSWGRLLGQVLPRHALPAQNETMPEPKAESGAARFSKPYDRVILAIIDESTAFAHERFRRPDGSSRVSYLWLQSAPHLAEATYPPFGAEYDRHGIDRLTKPPRGARRRDLIDEETLYRACGALDMGLGTPQALARRAGHGTAVSDLAAGFCAAVRPANGAAPAAQANGNAMQITPDDFDLALVALPERLIMDTSGTFAEIFILLGMIRLLAHVERRSREDHKDYPLVLNVSLGLTAGPRDGTSLLDRFIAAVTAERGEARAPIRFVIPAGNFRQSRVHAVLEGPTTDDAPLFWKIQPDDPTPSFLEIWSPQLPARPEQLPFTLAVRRDPQETPAALGPVPLDGVFDLGQDGRFLMRCYTQWVPKDERADAAGRIRVTLAVPPSVPGTRGAPYTDPGLWELRFAHYPEAQAQDAVWPLDLVVQRDDMIPGYRGGGRQSSLFDHGYRAQDERGFVVTTDKPGPDGRLPHVRRAGTINAFATAPEIVVVGGCYADTLEPVDYSGEGGQAAGRDLRGVDVAAPAAVHRSRGRIQAAGTRSGSRIGVRGTSIAAPYMSRELAKALRPVSERPKLSGVSLLHRTTQDSQPPPVIAMGETTPESYWEQPEAGEAVGFEG